MIHEKPRHWFDRYAMLCLNNRGIPLVLPAIVLLAPFSFFDPGPGARPLWWQIGFALVGILLVVGFIAVFWRAVAIEAKPFWRQAKKGRKY